MQCLGIGDKRIGRRKVNRKLLLWCRKAGREAQIAVKGNTVGKERNWPGSPFHLNHLYQEKFSSDRMGRNKHWCPAQNGNLINLINELMETQAQYGWEDLRDSLTALIKCSTRYRALGDISTQLLAIVPKSWRIGEVTKRLKEENIVLL